MDAIDSGELIGWKAKFSNFFQKSTAPSQPGPNSCLLFPVATTWLQMKGY